MNQSSYVATTPVVLVSGQHRVKDLAADIIEEKVDARRCQLVELHAYWHVTFVVDGPVELQLCVRVCVCVCLFAWLGGCLPVRLPTPTTYT